MELHSSTIGIPGERDETGYCGYYSVGTAYVLADGPEVLIGLRFEAQPEEVLLVAWRRRGQEVPLTEAAAREPFVQQAVKQLLDLDHVRKVKLLVGKAVQVQTTD